MDYNEQIQNLNANVPKYQEMQTHVFSDKTVFKITENGASNFKIITPIVEALLLTYQLFIKRKFVASYNKWSYSLVTSYMSEYDTFDKIIYYTSNISEEAYNKFHIIHITKGYDIFDLAKAHEGYMQNASMALQTSQTHRIAVVKINEHTTVILTNKIDHDQAQTYFSLVPIVFQKNELSEELIMSFLSLAEENYSHIFDTLNKIYATIDLTTMKLERTKNALKNTFNNNKAIKALDNSIAAEQNSIKGYYDSITNILTRVKELELKKLALLSRNIEETMSEFIDYLSSNKFITDITSNSEFLTLTIDTPIYFVDEQLIETLIKTSNSYLNQYKNNYESKLVQFIKEVFLDKKYIITTRTYANINITRLNELLTGQRGSNVRNIVNGYADKERFTAQLPQPHLTYHNCFGGNETHLYKALEENDLIGFVAQLIASCQNLNFGDSTVGCEFLKDIYANCKNIKCITVNDTNEKISFLEWKERSE